MSDENASIQEAAASEQTLLRVAPAKKRKTKAIMLGVKVWAHARALDAFEHATTLAQAKADLNALLAGGVPMYAWDFTPDQLAKMQANEDLRGITAGWMRNVLTATLSVDRFDDGAGGPAALVHDIYAEDGETLLRSDPLPAGFKAFSLLFRDAVIEMRFRVAAFETEQYWSAEKNVSAPVPSGHGRADTNIADSAEMKATPAPEAGKESSQMEVADPARSRTTPHAPRSETPAGELPAPAPLGSTVE